MINCSRFRQLNGFVVLMDAFKFAHHSGDERVANKTAIVFANLAHDLGYQGVTVNVRLNFFNVFYKGA
uniref:Uncharacterized protein n=1 Tax=Parascaris equorum TaxID=6256 RepID=A0A914R6I9_PAREQ